MSAPFQHIKPVTDKGTYRDLARTASLDRIGLEDKPLI
jgi:hypothetical protein